MVSIFGRMDTSAVPGLESGRRAGLSRVVFLILVLAQTTLVGCASKILKVENSGELLKNDEYEKQISVADISALPASGEYVRLPGPEPVPGSFVKTKKGKLVQSKKAAKAAKAAAAAAQAPVVNPAVPVASPTPSAHPPPTEDGEGFAIRRPLKDPYRVGEKVTLEASYFSVVAGELTLEVRPFVQVNGRKAYNFAGTATSTSVFAMFYAVNDWFETFVDFETLTPYNYALHVKETKQLREARSLFNWSQKKAIFWDRKVNSEKQIEEKKQEWDIPEYSQNIFSLAYYVRAFQLRPGKKIAIRLAHENENLVVTTEVLRRERIKTPAGEFDTLVTKPKIEINGVFKPVGDIFIWYTDDDRKFIVRMESKIKIGTVLAEAKSVERGQP